MFELKNDGQNESNENDWAKNPQKMENTKLVSFGR